VVASFASVNLVNTSAGAILLHRFDGAQWNVSDLHRANAGGAVVPSAGALTMPGIDFDAFGQVQPAWVELTDALAGPPRYHVQSWSGTAWQGLGSADGAVDNPTTGLSAMLRLAKTAAGAPQIAFVATARIGAAPTIGVSVYVP
jgi:hypothetical protein